jgi:hypothetical protein
MTTKSELLNFLNNYYNGYNWSLPTSKIPIELVDQEVIDIIVERYPSNFERLPLDKMEYSISQKICRDVLNNSYVTRATDLTYRLIFRDMPLLYKDYYMCKQAYEYNPILAVYMPEQFITYDMVLNLSKTKYTENPEYLLNSLDWVPKRYRTYEICLNYVRLNGYNITYVSEEMINEELCEEAVKISLCINFVPEQFKTYNMCLYVAGNPRAGGRSHWNERYNVLDQIPEKFKTPELLNRYNTRYTGQWI